MKICFDCGKKIKDGEEVVELLAGAVIHVECRDALEKRLEAINELEVEK